MGVQPEYPRFCRDCAWVDPQEGSFSSTFYIKCSHPTVNAGRGEYLATGKADVYCSTARTGWFKACGVGAKLWELREMKSGSRKQKEEG